MPNLVVGSLAIAHWFNPPPREPKDRDEFASTPREGWDTYWDARWTGSQLDRDGVATPDELYTIKLSHSFWIINSDQNWNKHMYDLLWLKDQGAVVVEEIYPLLYTAWEDIHGKKRVNLNMTSEEFFGDAVTRIYDHDSIHDSVAYGDRAMYEYLLKPGEDVAIDHKRMWEWPHEDLVKLFREEVAATALERLVIPSDYRISPGLAWKWSLRRTITSLTKGKSARFIVENFEHFMTPDLYVERHLANRHKLIPLEGK